MVECKACQKICLSHYPLCDLCYEKAQNVFKLSTFIDKDGYKRLIWGDGETNHIWMPNGERMSSLMHRVVAYKYFYEPNKLNHRYDFAGYQVHHKDKNKLNNHHTNLQILTPEEHEEAHGIKQVIYIPKKQTNKPQKKYEPYRRENYDWYESREHLRSKYQDYYTSQNYNEKHTIIHKQPAYGEIILYLILFLVSGWIFGVLGYIISGIILYHLYYMK